LPDGVVRNDGTVHAIVIENPDAMTWIEVPDPKPGEGEVVIDVTAAGVNRADVSQRQGQYPPPPGAPPYPGLECSGVISAIGPGVADHRVDDSVCALLAGGGYAERVVVPAGQLLPVPAGLLLVEAAALPEVACTVWSNVVDVAHLRAGETLLVHGGGGGIGTFAVQLGKALGARVVVTARAGKHDALRELGADLTIDYTSADFVEATREFTGGHGADVVLDIMGAKYLGRNVAVLATGGRVVTIGLQGGRTGELDLGALMATRGSISATTLRARPVEDKARIVRGVRDQVWPLVEARTIRPIIDTTMPMAEATAAHRRMESSDHIGKILLLP
jgi:putative PIG3 family NAD(P)H quinone oxidoreductase